MVLYIMRGEISKLAALSWTETICSSIGQWLQSYSLFTSPMLSWWATSARTSVHTSPISCTELTRSVVLFSWRIAAPCGRLTHWFRIL